jgi:glycosyltransferase involved in cell wall biosynthesis
VGQGADGFDARSPLEEFLANPVGGVLLLDEFEKAHNALHHLCLQMFDQLAPLLDAWRGLSADLRRDFDLVIAGPAGWSSEATLARIRSEAVYLGYVPELDLPGLTAGATVFVYPSLYEGFGFPVAQAMADGIRSRAGTSVDARSRNTSAKGEARPERGMWPDAARHTDDRSEGR